MQYHLFIRVNQDQIDRIEFPSSSNPYPIYSAPETTHLSGLLAQKHFLVGVCPKSPLSWYLVSPFHFYPRLKAKQNGRQCLLLYSLVMLSSGKYHTFYRRKVDWGRPTSFDRYLCTCVVFCWISELAECLNIYLNMEPVFSFSTRSHRWYDWLFKMELFIKGQLNHTPKDLSFPQGLVQEKKNPLNMMFFPHLRNCSFKVM